MPNKAFLEITNACNLSCVFCHGTKREIRYMSSEEFSTAAEKLRGFAEYLYFHVMGEPLLHPQLFEFLGTAKALGFKVILTTNGTLLNKKTDILLGENKPFKISISLHSFEANHSSSALEQYLDECFEFCRTASQKGIICVLRLWNIGGKASLNDYIIEKMHLYFDTENSEWKKIYSGFKIKENIFLEWGELFEWPDNQADFLSDSHFCYALRDQIAVLSDGTAVPCCLDADGSINLGNIFELPLASILSSERANALKNSFNNRKIKESLCQRCGYSVSKSFKSPKKH